MFTSVSPEVSNAYPAEAIRFARDEAARDADDVAAFLAGTGLAPPRGATRPFPPGTLLDLAAFARVRRWEAAGHTAHTEAGLPTADAILRHVHGGLLAAATNAVAVPDGAYHRAVWTLAVDRFAWAARTELDADVALDTEGEDELVEALARFLWAHRQVAPILDQEAAP